MATAAPLLLGLQVAGTIMGYNAQQQQAAADMAAGKANAELLEKNAVLARDKADREERRYRAGARRELNAIDTAYAAAGVTMSGSPMDVVMDSVTQIEQDALNIQYAGELEAQQLEAEADIQRRYGASRASASRAGAAATLLGGIGAIGRSFGVNQPAAAPAYGGAQGGGYGYAAGIQ